MREEEYQEARHEFLSMRPRALDEDYRACLRAIGAIDKAKPNNMHGRKKIFVYLFNNLKKKYE